MNEFDGTVVMPDTLINPSAVEHVRGHMFVAAHPVNISAGAHPQPDPYVWHKTSDFDPPTRWPWEHE